MATYDEQLKKLNELDRLTWAELMEGVQEAMINNYKYVEEFEMPGACYALWEAFKLYQIDREVDELMDEAVKLWMMGKLNEYLDDAPAGPTKADLKTWQKEKELGNRRYGSMKQYYVVSTTTNHDNKEIERVKTMDKDVLLDLLNSDNGLDYKRIVIVKK